MSKGSLIKAISFDNVSNLKSRRRIKTNPKKHPISSLELGVK